MTTNQSENDFNILTIIDDLLGKLDLSDEHKDRALEDSFTKLATTVFSNQISSDPIKNRLISIIKAGLLHPRSRLVRKCSIYLLEEAFSGLDKIVSIAIALEERQPHIVLPAIEHLGDIPPFSYEAEFKLTLYRRVFNHKVERGIVKAVRQFACLEFKELSKDDFETYFSAFLPAIITKGNILVRIHEDENLQDFMNDCTRQLSQCIMNLDNFARRWMNAICDYRFQPLAFFFVLVILLFAIEQIDDVGYFQQCEQSLLFLKCQAMRVEEKCLRPFCQRIVSFIQQRIEVILSLSTDEQGCDKKQKANDDITAIVPDTNDLGCVWSNNQYHPLNLLHYIQAIETSGCKEQHLSFVANCLTHVLELQRNFSLIEYTLKLGKELISSRGLLTKEERDSNSQLTYSKLLRLTTLRLVLANPQFINPIIRSLLERLQELKCNSMYQPGTKTNRAITFHYQCLIVLVRHCYGDIDHINRQKLTIECISMLNFNQPPPPMMRALLEILCSSLVDQYEDILLRLSNDLLAGRFAAILRHMAVLYSARSQFDKVLSIVYILMGGVGHQHFATRCYCIAALHEMTLICQTQFWTNNPSIKNAIVAIASPMISIKSNQSRFVSGMCNDFVMTSRLKLDDLTHELSVFTKIPACYPPALIDSFDESYFSNVPLALKQVEFSTASVLPRQENDGNEKIETIALPTNSHLGDNMQRKITLCTVTQEDENVKKGELIVVASLVNSAANLGGLCRTCEILGAKKLVISSLDKISLTEFRALSVTSELHMSIEEQPIRDLPAYLRAMTRCGYAIVAIEQCTRSVPLDQFQFAEKTVMVLGEERRGIPPDILTLCTDFVEVQQYGVTRSLNVHVCASLGIYTYCLQHLSRDRL